MGISVGRGLAAQAEKALKKLKSGQRVARFNYVNASYAATDNGPPGGKGAYCGPLKVGNTVYSIFRLPREC